MNLASVKSSPANFSADPLPDLSVRPSVRPSVSTRFVALSNLDLGCGGCGGGAKERGINKAWRVGRGLVSPEEKEEVKAYVV